jgi:hypothetical protein
MVKRIVQFAEEDEDESEQEDGAGTMVIRYLD